jgi:hypothetical protein
LSKLAILLDNFTPSNSRLRSSSSARKNLCVVVHHIIADGDWVWAHINFLNLYNDDPNDRGIAGVDIFNFNSDGKIEHWDVLQWVPDRCKKVYTGHPEAGNQDTDYSS